MMNSRGCGIRRTLNSLPLVVAIAACAASGPRAEPILDGPAGEEPYPDPLNLPAAHVDAIGGRAAVEAVRGYYATGTEVIVGQRSKTEEVTQ